MTNKFEKMTDEQKKLLIQLDGADGKNDCVIHKKDAVKYLNKEILHLKEETKKHQDSHGIYNNGLPNELSELIALQIIQAKIQKGPNEIKLDRASTYGDAINIQSPKVKDFRLASDNQI
jgi:hypothetical protein